jgi:hypothetical protein
MSDPIGNGSVAGNGSAPAPEAAGQTPSGAGPGGAAGDPVEVARTFLDAVTWGDHNKVWECFGLEARTAVLKVASNRGMDEGLSARLRDGTASTAERDEFLADLVNGLRSDLAGNDLDTLEFELDPEPQEPGRARVVVNCPIPPPMGGFLPAASVELADEAGEWKVVRLLPQASK